MVEASCYYLLELLKMKVLQQQVKKNRSFEKVQNIMLGQYVCLCVCVCVGGGMDKFHISTPSHS